MLFTCKPRNSYTCKIKLLVQTATISQICEYLDRRYLPLFLAEEILPKFGWDGLMLKSLHYLHSVSGNNSLHALHPFQVNDSSLHRVTYRVVSNRQNTLKPSLDLLLLKKLLCYFNLFIVIFIWVSSSIFIKKII